jgi:hypothetical protein
MALCLVAVASAGCSLLLSTSDLTEAGPDGGTGPSPTGEAGADGATSGDATTDAPVVSPDGSARFCETLSPAPKFCADFDGTGAVHEGWDTTVISPDDTVGSLARDALGRDRSSLVAKLTAPQSCSYARVAKTFPTSGFGMRVSFAFRPASPWTTDSIISLFNAEGDNADCGILYHFEVGLARVHLQYGNPEANDMFEWDGAPALDAWSTIDTTIDPNGILTIVLNGKKVLTLDLPAGCTPGNEVYIAPGFHCEQEVHEARYDDVIVDYP